MKTIVTREIMATIPAAFAWPAKEKNVIAANRAIARIMVLFILETFSGNLDDYWQR
ncbi:hypothetical protein GWO52_02095 [Corynebacterium macginleyi]|uniref:hypothetical protein n=1 Tax=Corynebacterium macginleyi TaxID=38290 RepID=UPI00190C3A3C|nr:hypothetical protein [Corynebacterium macginleyi]MBK4137287.1 hypothetical protein [Corynebacterium macginleyi]